jgi:hypothetical protein
LSCVGFDWRRDEFPALAFDEGRQIGFIAQELERVVPEVVTRDCNGDYAVAHGEMVPLLAAALKEQHAQTQEALADKNAEIAALKMRLAWLEELVAPRSMHTSGE